MNETDTVSTEPSLLRHVKLGLFLSIEIPSVCVAMYVLYKLCRSRELRSRLNNQSVMVMLFATFLELSSELPITLQFLATGRVRPSTSSFCLYWIWYNFSLQSTNLLLMAFTSIQRHILIFHTALVQSRMGRIKWHYAPLIYCVSYIPLFYLICVILYPCENFFDFSALLCGPICYNKVTWLSSFDWISNILIPSVLTPLASITLLLRVVLQAKKMKRALTWRTRRKMTIQLLSIATLYSVFWTPLASISLIRLYFISTFFDTGTIYYLYYAPYLVQLLLPFVCFACLPELWPGNDRTEIQRTITNRPVTTRRGNTVID